MKIQFLGHKEQVVLSLLQGGKSASSEAVIDEALRLVEERYQEPDEARRSGGDSTGNGSLDRTARQFANLRRLGEKVEAMPAAAVTDGLSNSGLSR